MLKKAVWPLLCRDRAGEAVDSPRFRVDFPEKPTEKSKKCHPIRQKSRDKSKLPQQFAKVEPARAQNRVPFVPELTPSWLRTSRLSDFKCPITGSMAERHFHPAVRFPQRNSFAFSRADEPFARTVEQARVGWKPNVFFLHGGVNVHAVQLGWFDNLFAQPGSDGFREHFLDARLFQIAAPVRHGRRVDGRSG